MRARQQAWMNRRRARRQTPLVIGVSDPDEFLESAAITTETPFDRASLLDEFERLVQRIAIKLTPQERRILYAKAQGFTEREIADILGTSPKTVGTQYARAQKKLRRSA